MLNTVEHMPDVDIVFAEDRQHAPAGRSLPWAETRNGVTVVIEPKSHYAEDMRAFRLDAREFCDYADWTKNGPRARFFRHIDTCGADLIRKTRALIAFEIADGLYDQFDFHVGAGR